MKRAPDDATTDAEPGREAKRPTPGLPKCALMIDLFRLLPPGDMPTLGPVTYVTLRDAPDGEGESESDEDDAPSQQWHVLEDAERDALGHDAPPDAARFDVTWPDDDGRRLTVVQLGAPDLPSYLAGVADAEAPPPGTASGLLLSSKASVLTALARDAPAVAVVRQVGADPGTLRERLPLRVPQQRALIAMASAVGDALTAALGRLAAPGGSSQQWLFFLCDVGKERSPAAFFLARLALAVRLANARAPEWTRSVRDAVAAPDSIIEEARWRMARDAKKSMEETGRLLFDECIVRFATPASEATALPPGPTVEELKCTACGRAQHVSHPAGVVACRPLAAAPAWPDHLADFYCSARCATSDDATATCDEASDA